MISDSVLGLLLLIAALGPGYVYIWVAEQYGPRHSRSQTLELAQLALVGALTSLVAVTAVLLVASRLNELDVSKLVKDPRDYLAVESIRVLLAVLAALVLSYISAGLVAAAIFVRPGKRSVRAGEAWYLKFEIDRPGGKAVAVSAELKDGRTVSGSLRSHSVGESDRKDLAINGPIFVKFPVGDTVKIDYDFVLLQAEEIVSIAGKYVDGEKVEDAPKD